MSRKLKRFIALILVAILVIPSAWVTPVAEAAENEDIPVLLYHRIVDNPSNEWTDTSIENFEETMEYLHDNGYNTLSSEQYVNIMDGKEEAPENPILLTFDDGTPDFITNALPILDDYNMNAVLFIVSDWIGDGARMSEEQLKSLANKSNVSLENHTKTHDGDIWGTDGSKRSEITKEQAEEQIREANTYLKSITGKNPVLMAYPYGSYSDVTKEVNQENGIKYAFKVGYPNEGNHVMGRHYILEQDLAEIAKMIGGPVPEVKPTPEPGEQTETKTVYHESFENGVGVATQSGDAQLKAVSDIVFEGNDDGKALYVSNRQNDYSAADLNFSDIGLEDGKTYKVTITGYVDSDETVPTGGQAVLSTVDSYTWLSNVNFVAGQAFTLTGEYTVGSKENDTKLRVQSNEDGKTVPFYIGDVKITSQAQTEPTPDPKPETPFEPGEIKSYDFEDGVQGWENRGTAKIAVTEDSYSGNQALITTGRTDGWHGPSVKVTDLMEKGAKYEVSGYVKLVEGQPTSNVKLSANQPGGGNEYPTIQGPQAVTDSEWVLFKGEYTFDLTATDVNIYFEATEVATEFIIDDVKIVQIAAAPDLGGDEDLDQSGITSNFEDGVQNWGPRGSGYETIATDAAAHTGSQSLLTNAPNQYEGPLLNVLGKMHPGHIYDLSVWVKMQEGQPATTVRMSVQSGETTFTNVSPNVTVTDQEWVELTGQFTLSSSTAVLNAYVELAEKPNSERLFYIDDFTLTHVGKVGQKPPVQLDLDAISEVYKNDFLIGNAISDTDLNGDSLKLLKHHHNVVTAENAMKPEYAYNAAGEFDFTSEDALVENVLDEGLDLVGHVLVWHQQSREALHTDENGKPLSREEALANLRNHVKTTVKHFGTNVISWDVVNEAMNDNPPNPSDWKGSLRQSGWLTSIGADYVEQAFLAAHEVLVENGWEDDIQLYYNDYNDDNQNKAEAIKNMIEEINAKYEGKIDGKLIDGMGMQAHYNLSTNPENVRSSLEKFTSIGLEVSITELDVTAGGNSELSEKEEVEQAYLYAQLFKLYKEYSDDIARVTFWGLHDARSWRSTQSPLVFDADLQAKEAYFAVIDPETYLENHVPIEKVVNQGTAYFGTPTIDGAIDDIWNDVPELPINRYQGAWQGAHGVAKTLWDDENLYVLVNVVNNDQLDKSSANEYEQDSVEVFLDQNNAKTPSYQGDDGQYRVNFDNETSFNTTSSTEGFDSATKVDGTNYMVEIKIPLSSITPKADMKIGFDVQINDGKDGARQSSAIWNDITGVGYQDTSVFGELTLVKSGAPDPGTPGTPDPEVPGSPDPEVPGTPDPEVPGTPDPEVPGTPDPEVPGTPDPETPESPESTDKDPEVTKPVVKDPSKDVEPGKTLPNTATNSYNLLVLGTILLVISAGYIVVNRRKRA